jgi:hypothetical protein
MSKCDPGHPATLAFLAMTQHQLDQKALARLREVMKSERWAQDEEARAFLSEAERLIVDKASGPNP